MKKMVLCVIGGLIGLALCFSCAAEQPAEKDADSGTVKADSSNPVQILILNKSEDDIIALYKEPYEQLYADQAIISAVIQQKTADLTKTSSLKKHDMCMQIKCKSMRELHRIMKPSVDTQTEEKPSNDKKIGNLLLRKVLRASAIAKGAQEL